MASQETDIKRNTERYFVVSETLFQKESSILKTSY